MEKKYLCELCGEKKLTLDEYLKVDISKTAMCEDCKSKKKINRSMIKVGYNFRNNI